MANKSISFPGSLIESCLPVGYITDLMNIYLMTGNSPTSSPNYSFIALHTVTRFLAFLLLSRLGSAATPFQNSGWLRLLQRGILRVYAVYGEQQSLAKQMREAEFQSLITRMLEKGST